MFSFNKAPGSKSHIILDLYILYGSKILAYLFCLIAIQEQWIHKPLEGTQILQPIEDSQILDEAKWSNQAELLAKKLKETLGQRPEYHSLNLVDPEFIRNEILHMRAK